MSPGLTVGWLRREDLLTVDGTIPQEWNVELSSSLLLAVDAT